MALPRAALEMGKIAFAKVGARREPMRDLESAGRPIQELVSGEGTYLALLAFSRGLVRGGRWLSQVLIGASRTRRPPKLFRPLWVLWLGRR